LVTFDDTTLFVAGETISKRDAIYLHTDGLAYRASAKSLSSSFEVGFALSGAISGNSFPVDTREGKVLGGFVNLDVGARYFLSESFGGISTLGPSSAGSIVYQVGIAKTSEELIFKPRLLVRKANS